MKPLRPWVMLPSAWIQRGGLCNFRWERNGAGSGNTMALMLLIVIAHQADIDTGVARITYDQFEAITDKSRAKIAKGITTLKRHMLIDVEGASRSTFKICNYRRDRGWAALPAKHLYDKDGCIAMFKGFTLRSPNELAALKIYLLIAAYRDRDTNSTSIGFDKISELTGIDRAQIRLAKSHLIASSLMHVDPTKPDGAAAYFIYRLYGLYPRRHAGSTGRGDATAMPGTEG
ncbi:hypothetical protein MKK88_03365 [Methylobacterium sp. E-005]|uniref:hypothetical protein n=1 Tax=Methylobacterium sp. E-005 TaxID=2836549 RepID=UPI001FBADB4B|nr:hypothetical protein [Methylobacterium sp. E-005]MCJ2085035.1 hypothetical protein [Methylobacterium sp. E-005]